MFDDMIIFTQMGILRHLRRLLHGAFLSQVLLYRQTSTPGQCRLFRHHPIGDGHCVHGHICRREYHLREVG